MANAGEKAISYLVKRAGGSKPAIKFVEYLEERKNGTFSYEELYKNLDIPVESFNGLIKRFSESMIIQPLDKEGNRMDPLNIDYEENPPEKFKTGAMYDDMSTTFLSSKFLKKMYSKMMD